MTDVNSVIQEAEKGTAIQALEGFKLRSIADLVEQAAQRNDMTYYRIAKILEVSPSHLVQIRRGVTPLTEHHSERLAKLLDEPAGAVYAEAKAARAKRTELKTFWARIAKALKGGSLVVFVGVFAPWPDASAAASPGARAIDAIYIMRTRLARWLMRRRRADVRRGCAFAPACAPGWGM